MSKETRLRGRSRPKFWSGDQFGFETSAFLLRRDVKSDVTRICRPRSSKPSLSRRQTAYRHTDSHNVRRARKCSTSTTTPSLTTRCYATPRRHRDVIFHLISDSSSSSSCEHRQGSVGRRGTSCPRTAPLIGLRAARLRWDRPCIVFRPASCAVISRTARFNNEIYGRPAYLTFGKRAASTDRWPDHC